MKLYRFSIRLLNALIVLLSVARFSLAEDATAQASEQKEAAFATTEAQNLVQFVDYSSRAVRDGAMSPPGNCADPFPRPGAIPATSISDRIFSKLSACEISELAKVNGKMAVSFQFDLRRSQSREMLEEVADEVTLGGRHAKYFFPIPTRTYPQLEKALGVVTKEMKEQKVSRVSLGEIADLAAYEVKKRLEQGEVGECYSLEVYDGAIVPSVRMVPVSPNIQKKIDALFKPPARPTKLSVLEHSQFTQGVMTLEEIAELRAIRKATELFGTNTEIALDKAGGMWTNLRAEFTGSGQMTCGQHTATFVEFILKLEDRGLLKHFNTSGTVTKVMSLTDDWARGGHMAVKLTLGRSQRPFVLDTWYEPGGKPAHILSEEDWRSLPITYFKRPIFKDVVGLPETVDSPSR